MMWLGQNNEQYITTRELGKGGEGSVYELQSHHDLVLKSYNEPITPQRLQKLQAMVAMRTPAIEAYAAWPVDIVHDSHGNYGFVMKKLTGYIPLHHVFSPMDRKKMFPDKGYNFLVHVARNVATAFYRLHSAGLVVGDVNEGNILVSASGMIAFIDCDSFQVKNNDTYFFCEVGVPRYTPPELLKKKTFENVVRTANTDNFSMAILLFQLLFLGRHPFAGKNKTSGDMDEETAIRLGHFAYSLTAEKKKLSPPPGSYPITSLPEDIVQFFHRAFENTDRPAPIEWMNALHGLLQNMSTCDMSRLHTYPSMLSECPWCAFRKNNGILYFLDDTYTQANAALGNIEHFINGFKPTKPELKKWSFSGKVPQLRPTPLPKEIITARKMRLWLSISLIVTAIIMLFIVPVAALFPALIAAHVYTRSGWVKKLKQEKKARTEQYQSLTRKLHTLIREYEHPSDLPNYNKSLDALLLLIHDFRRLPDELERRIKLQEEQLYNEQLDDYLRQFDITKHPIPSIGDTRKDALYNAGIYNAAHIPRLATTKVPGIGPAYQQVLYSWRRQMSANFTYIPDNYRLTIARQKATSEVAALQHKLEQNIRTQYQSLNFLKVNINNRLSLLESQLNKLYIALKQAEVDNLAFRKVAA